MSHTVNISIGGCHKLDGLELFLRNCQAAVEAGKFHQPETKSEVIQAWRAVLEGILWQAQQDGFIREE